MEVIKKLDIPATFFYKQVIDSVIFDIYQQTGKTLLPTQLEEFEYIKQFSKNSKAKIKIEKLIENTAYYFRTSTTRNDFCIQYNIQVIDDHSCEIRYVETMTSFGVLQKMNDLIFGMLLFHIKKQRFKKMLQMIETEY